MRPWQEPEEIPVPDELYASVGGHPLVARTLARRGLVDAAAVCGFLNPDDYQPAPPWVMPGMAEAVERLERALGQGEPVCVWGDFDVDGQTSTALLVSALRELGGEVSFHIPVRARESHGVNLPYLQQVIDQGARLLLTCDTGITANEAVDYARQCGVDVLITDHHELPPSLPEARAIINPRLLPAGHPLAALPGVGVAYKLAEALYQRFGRPEGSQAHLDLAALGIVADVALLKGDTRYLLQRGLNVLRQANRVGLRAMLELAEIAPANLTEEHIGFLLGPRLNALGRLSDANVAVEFFTTGDLSRARVIAQQLEGLNAERQFKTSQVFQGALSMIAQDPALLDPSVLVLAHPSWPAGVVGIVASRLVERFQRPVVLIASPPGEPARGSARSVEGVNITAAIAAQADLLKGFGGHPLAAGFSLEAERIPEFRRRLARAVRSQRGEALPEPALSIDAYLALPELTLELVSDLERLAPFGPGNPPLLLASRNLKLLSAAPIGRGGEHLAMTVEDELGHTSRVLWWQGAGWDQPEWRFDLAYTARSSTFGGERSVQLEWVDFRPLAESVLSLKSEEHALEVVDYRQEAHPVPVLEKLAAQGELQVWAEADAYPQVGGTSRYALVPGPALAIWTTPPARAELQAVLEQVQPKVVYLFAVDPQDGALEAFLKRLAGLVKYTLNQNQGRASLKALAAATAQREAALRLGIAWLASRGYVRVLSEAQDELVFAPGDGRESADLALVTSQLKALLEETAAYRLYFHRTDKNIIIP